MIRQPPSLFWGRADKTRYRRGEPDEHLFAEVDDLAWRSSCNVGVKPVLHGHRRVVRRRPGPRACSHCLRNWRAGWGTPRTASQETTP